MTPGRRNRLIAAASIFAGLIILTWVLESLSMDLRLSGLFFGPERGFFLRDRQPWHALWQYGTIPGVVLLIASVMGLGLTFIKPPLASWRRPLAIVALTGILGAGLIVNGILKPYWGRPRPVQTTVFLGEWDYRPISSPGVPGRGESFPCGHCTMGYLFLTLFFLRKQNRALAYGGTAFGLGYGALLSTARVVQGAHFFSDTLWSGGIILITAVTLDALLPESLGHSNGHANGNRKAKILAVVLALAVSVTAALLFLTRRPFFEHLKIILPLYEPNRTLILYANAPLQKKIIRYGPGETPRVLFESDGFRYPTAGYSLDVKGRNLVKDFEVDLVLSTSGPYAEIHNQVTVILPDRLKGRLEVRFLPLDEDKEGPD